MSKFSTRRGRVIDLRKMSANKRPPARAGGRASGVPRRMSLHARRRRVRAFAVLASVVLIWMVVLGVSKLSYSPKFTINEIAILGAEKTPSSLVRAYVETKLYDGANSLLSSGNIFLYPRAGIEKSVTEYFPRISAAEISRAGLLAQAITVTVKEREPFALWCSDGVLLGSVPEDCYLMDISGFIFAPLGAGPKEGSQTGVEPLAGFAHASTSSSSPYLIFGGGLPAQTALSAGSSPVGQKFLPANISRILKTDKALRQAGFAPERIYAEDEQDFSIQFREGFILRGQFDAEPGTLVRNLQLALSSDSLRGKADKIEYIDLRFGNRVYYKNRQ